MLDYKEIYRNKDKKPYVNNDVGLGAKSLLATGVDSYKMISRYNGKEFEFDIFKDHATSAVAKFEEDGTMNKSYEVDGEHSCYYRETTKKNGVIVEAEVKKHRKQEYFNGIENQLAYIDDIEFIVADKGSGVEFPKDIKSTVTYKTDSILVGASDYYAVPQLLLKPGETSNVLINYGKINFEELEMKSYSGNVCFIMNINEVDVTPSRESVIWNARTRKAVSEMFVKAQNTIEAEIKNRLKDTKNLSDFTYDSRQLTNSRNMTELSELYKVIDSSKINLNFRNFKLYDCLQKADSVFFKDEFTMTNTGMKGYNHSSSNLKDTDYKFNLLSRDFISKMSVKDVTNEVYLYVGNTKYKGISRYVHKINNSNRSEVNIIYMKPDVYERYLKKVEKNGVKKFLKKCYESKKPDASIEILMGEILRLVENKSIPILFEHDIDKSKMFNIDEDFEKSDERLHMTYAEQQKALGKVSANLSHSLGGYRSNIYIDEDYFVGKFNVILYRNNNNMIDFFRNNFYDKNTSFIGLSDDNFKRFKDVKGTKLLLNSLFKIEFGELSFTELGSSILRPEALEYIKTQYKAEKNKKLTFTNDDIYSFLDGNFCKLKVNPGEFKGGINDVIESKTYRKKRINKSKEDLREILNNNNNKSILNTN